MKVFVCSITIAIVFVLLGIAFYIIARRVTRQKEKEHKFKLLSWISFYVAVGVVIGSSIVFIMLNNQSSLN